MIAVQEDFADLNKIKERWHWSMPWGEGNSKLGKYSEYKNMITSPDGLKICCTTHPTDVYHMPRLFWKEAPMGYGKYTAEMTVPPQSSVNTFVLYTRAHYMKLVRTIMPEIDIAEYGLHNDPDKLNVAVHQWHRNPSFMNHWDYQDIVKRHDLDYVGHKQKSKQMDWTGEKHEHSCEITPCKCVIYLDGKKVLVVRGKFYPHFTPTFGQTLADWIKEPEFKTSIIHSFTFEQ